MSEDNELKVKKLADGVYKNVKTGDIVCRTTKIYEQIKDAVKAGKRYIVLLGGSRSGKTYSAMSLILDVALHTKVKINVVRKTLTRAERGVMKDFKEIMENREMYDRKRYNGETHTYTFSNGSTLTFLIAPDEDSVKGVSSSILFCDECSELENLIFLQLQQRTENFIILTLNPDISEDHWVYKRLLRRDSEGNLMDNNVAYFHSTYKDNIFLAPNIIKTIESYEPTPENILAGSANEPYWKIYGLGVQAEVSGVIFKYDIVDTMPNDLEYVCYGMDMGYSNDPSVLILKGEKTQEINGILYDCIYFDEIIYERELLVTRNMNNPDIKSLQQRFEEEKVSKTIPIYADSSSPQQIADLAASGYNILPVVKTMGADRSGSIAYGISIMKGYKIFLTDRSINGRKEFDFYREERRGEKIVRIGDDHMIDACRYAALSSCPKTFLGKGIYEPRRVNMYKSVDMSRYG